MTTNAEARSALEAQRIEKQAEIDALQAKLTEELEDMSNLDTVMSGLESQSPTPGTDTNINVTVPVPTVTVDIPETVINVNVPEAPAPVITIEPAQITVEATTPNVTADVHVNPNISLNIPEGSIVTELTGTGIAEAIAASNAIMLQRLEEVRQDLRAVARAANVNVPGLLND
jgi:carbon monoxide dehydrogenase subunit G